MPQSVELDMYLTDKILVPLILAISYKCILSRRALILSTIQKTTPNIQRTRPVEALSV